MIVFTHSDIKAFLGCRRAWNWSYVDDFKLPEKRTGALALGSRVHLAIEHYYATGGNPVTEHTRLSEIDAEWCETHGKPWEADEIWDDITVGRNCVIAHQDWLATSGEDSNYDVVGVEQTIQAEIIEGVSIRGKADTLFRDKDSGFLYLNDLKTAGGWGGSSSRDVLERSWQHTVYGLALTLERPDEILGGAFYTVMHKTKRPERATTPLVERWPVPASRRVLASRTPILEQICRDMVQTMNSIASEGHRHAYQSPSLDCRWCDFIQPCEVMDDSPISARSMLDSLYIRGGRHARYAADETSPAV